VTDADDFGHNLRMARRRADLSQERLARTAGLALDTVHKIEHGKRRPRLDTIWALADALEVKPGELLEGLRRPSLPFR
jgi:transcriptional regulator with XRE-family HTH domain